MERARMIGIVRDVGLGAMLVVASLAPVGSAHADDARLVYRGRALTEREVRSIGGPALRAPGDSIALARFLGDLVARLQNLGYLDARASAGWDSTSPGRLGVEVIEGPRLRWSAISVRAPSPEDSSRLAQDLALRREDWASPSDLSGAIERAVSAAVNRGHPYAYLGVSQWTRDSAGVRIELNGGLGPRVTIASVRFEGLRVTKRRLAEKSMGRVTGLPYNPAAAEQARERLSQLGLFRSVTLQGLEGEPDWSRGRLVYRVDEPRYNRFEGAVGFQGKGSAVGKLKLDLDNILGTGRATGLAWESRGKGVVQFGARYSEPLIFGLPLGIEAAFDQQVQDSTYVRTRWGARARVALSSQEKLEAGFEQERVVQERVQVEEAQLQSTVFALDRSTLDSPLGPRRGSHLRIGAGQTFKTERLRPEGKRTARASSVDLRGEWHRPLGDRSGVALELQASGRFSSERVLPLFERYPLGGTATLRGYDEEAFRVDRYALSRLEWRWFLGSGGERVFVFWDHARLATRLALPEGGDRMQDLDRDGVGFGLRLSAAGGLVGIDYGVPPGRPPLEGKIHLQLVSTF